MVRFGADVKGDRCPTVVSSFYFISAVDRANYVVATTSVVRRRNHLNRPDRPVA